MRSIALVTLFALLLAPVAMAEPSECHGNGTYACPEEPAEQPADETAESDEHNAYVVEVSTDTSDPSNSNVTGTYNTSSDDDAPVSSTSTGSHRTTVVQLDVREPDLPPYCEPWFGLHLGQIGSIPPATVTIRWECLLG